MPITHVLEVGPSSHQLSQQFGNIKEREFIGLQEDTIHKLDTLLGSCLCELPYTK